ncbi:MAG TPA: type II toxin-antitoxin system VapC family toxin [Deltaproteobacteria bacterium]|nr:type II toxin-antitoxin system VapC family toxin [Deltaproteobacteria bacterium]
MKAIDTNVLIRFLVKDDDQQTEIVYRLFKKAESSKEVLFVPIVVVLETVWVLESVYNISRQEILDSINELLLIPILEFEAQSAILSFVSSAKKTKIDLSEILIAHSALSAGCECLLTFDKQASGFRLIELLK